MPTDSDTEKRIQKFLEDMKLVTETAKALATKLEKIQNSLNDLLPLMSSMTSTRGVEKVESFPQEQVSTSTVTSPQRQRPIKTQRPSRPIPRPTTPETRPQKPITETTRSTESGISTASDVDTISRIFKILRDDIEKTTTGKEISRFLLDAQDKLLELKGFHPALREMRTLATEFKNREQLTKDDKTILIEKTYDWEQRMLA